MTTAPDALTNAGSADRLGLAVVKKVVEEHRGQVDVASNPGEGTTFTVRIPTAGLEPTDSESTAGPG